jgi:diguanylate cyclase (GGDEF)-like protein
MPEFTKGAAKVLETCVASFTESFRLGVVEVLAQQFRGAQPAEVLEIREQLSLLSQQLGAKAKPVRVHDAHNPLLKRIVIDERRRAAEAIDPPMQRAIDPQMVRYLQREVRPLEEIMAASWFHETQALRVPRLTDYLSIRFAEDAAVSQPKLRPRDYDEKFHILEAPTLFLPDLAYYRAKCAFRDAEIAVAYVDIDDFKSLNTRYTETVIDLKLLPVFMELLEAHTFARGHAYRFGGDEYVLLLPNTSERWAVELLRELSARLTTASFYGIQATLSVSAGLCHVDVDCMLTDREVLAKANLAKNFVKANEKGRIAHYSGPLFREEDLALV